jgi:hypothetical protein
MNPAKIVAAAAVAAAKTQTLGYCGSFTAAITFNLKT